MERGFIQSKLEIKFLLLYILSHTQEPLNLDQLTDVAMCDSGVGYFDLTAALAELVDSGHIDSQTGVYQITDKGRKNGAITEDELPYSVRIRCDQRLSELDEVQRRAKRAQSSLERLDSGAWRVTLTLDGEEENRFTLSLTLPLQEDGKRLIQRFKADPEAFFKQLKSL
jgi:hypothetical protein